jgi:starch phosphorylase
VKWIPHHEVRGVAYDMWIPGYHVSNCSLMRLWKAEAAESFDFQAFNHGDYYKAVEDKIYSENITKVLYPNDENFSGRQLRLAQQYFFVSCSLQDMLRTLIDIEIPVEEFHKIWAVQLNDTHPSIAVAELMRLLVDEHGLDWDKAWETTVNTFSYTNHTLMPEALEKWDFELFNHILPRHIEIIYEINRRFLDEVRRMFPGDEEKVKRLSIIDETGGRHVRMANLACIGSHKINGVAELHSELVKNQLLKDFYDMWPEKFLNITNGVTPRRWMLLSNPAMSGLIKETIGKAWVTKPEELRKLEPLAEDKSFCEKWRNIKHDNKCGLAKLIKVKTGIVVDPSSMFDCQVKRIHEYKRQHLNVLNIITLYNRLKNDPHFETTPRTFIFGGKAAPGYYMAKLIIKLINSVGEVVNSDPATKDIFKVVFFPDFGVKSGQRIYPAADLSEQISTAGLEASGTGNMKFSFNGALTIGTLDGANIEIRQEVGEENFFLFGRTTEEVQQLKDEGYTPRGFYETNPELREAIDLISYGYFSGGDRELFKPLVENLLNYDPFMLFADYQSYIDCQDRVSSAYRNNEHWTEMSVLNVARMGKFSSDRSIREYCENIWGIKTQK